jgi:hypothetical protein
VEKGDQNVAAVFRLRHDPHGRGPNPYAGSAQSRRGETERGQGARDDQTPHTTQYDIGLPVIEPWRRA